MGTPAKKVTAAERAADASATAADDEIDALIEAGAQKRSAPQPVQVPVPQPTPAAPPPAPAATQASPEPEQPWYSRLLNATGNAVLSFDEGIGQGVTLGFGPKLSALLTPNASDNTGIPREYARGSAYADFIANRDRELAEAKAANPGLYLAGNVAGAAAPAALIPELAPGTTIAGSPLLARIAAGGSAAGVMGAVSGAGNSRAPDMSGVLTDAAHSANTSALLGGALSTVVAAPQAVRESLARRAPAMRKAANEALADATNAYGGQLSQIAERSGPEYRAELGAAMRRLGANERSESDSLPSWFPMGARAYNERAREIAEQQGNAISNAVDEASTQQGVTVDRDEMASRLVAAANAAAGKGTRAGDAQAQILREQAEDILTRRGSEAYPQTLTARQAFNKKIALDESSGYNGVGPASDAVSAEAHRLAARGVREPLARSIADQALPETAQKYADAMRDYGYASDIAALSAKRAAQEHGNHLMSLHGLGAGEIGAHLLGGPGAVAATMGAGIVKNAGKDILASGLDTFASAGESAAAAGPQPFSLSSYALSPRALESATNDGQPMASPAYAQDSYKSRGHDITDAAKDTLRRYPQFYGPYLKQVQDASSDPARLAAVLTNLSKDDHFRPLYNQLLQMTQRQAETR